MKEIIGACIGASSVSFVRLRQNSQSAPEVTWAYTFTHNGDPKTVFHDKLRELNPDKKPVVITGRKFRHLINLESISEPEATELAYSYITGSSDDYTAITSLGGETFIVYALDETGKISNVFTRNQCASGTGEFFLQQIRRMGLPLHDVKEIALDAQPYKVSGRCSVFCKSDCTHALNKGIPQPEVISGLALMMAEKVEELLKKVKTGKVLVVGGVTANHLVMNYLKEKLSDIVIPTEAAYFEAMGAALHGFRKEIAPPLSFDDIFNGRASSFVFHEPLAQFRHLVRFDSMEKGNAKDGDTCILGLDVGSTTTKAVIIRVSDNQILASVYLYTLGNPVEAARKCYQELLNQVPENIKIIGLGTTGSGRQIAGLHALTEGIINEIVVHATAALYFDSEVDTIFEIGGQDAKYTYIVNKVPADYAMNEACSAGTGSFIEESAHESLGVSVTEIEPLAMLGDNPPNFSDQCAAFISSDIKTAMNENIDKNNILAGLVYSICLNYVNRVKGNRPVGKKIFMQGGVCYNKAIPIAMAALTGKEIIVPPEPGLMGAFGVALEVKEKIRLGFYQPKDFELKELAEREVKYQKPFICPGGKEKCDLACSVNIIEVQGKKYPFGGACNKYYNLLTHKKIDSGKYDFVAKRHELTFEKYANSALLPENAPTVGINLSFHTHTIYPLYHNFFTRLGFRVVLPDEVDEEGLEREMTSFCFPAQVSLGLFHNLIAKNPDYLFVPEIFEMYVEDADYHRLDFNCTCVFISGEPFYLKQAFKDLGISHKLITPFLNFANGFGTEEDKFVEIGRQMGIDDERAIREAFRHAVKIQNNYQDELFGIGRDFLDFLHRNPSEMAIVLVGRPYNSFTEFANKGIPRKFASRGFYVIPYDMFDYRTETIDDNQFWEGGKKILKIAKIIKRENQLFATYISNFSCGPDSLLLTTFRSIMGVKPSLTLELDGHTADAGINTRIDAAVDIINNYRKLSHSVKDTDYSDFTPAKIELGTNEGFFIDSDGNKFRLTDPSIDILIPSMGDLAAPLFAAGMKSQGFNAIAMPEGSPEILKYGRSVATGKECLPLLLCVGSMLDYIENRWDGKQKIAFFIVQGAGNCRLGQYPVFIRDVIKRKRLRNVATLTLMNEDGFAGIGPNFAMRGMQALIASDVMDDIRSGIMAHAVEPESGLEIFYDEYEKIKHTFKAKPDNIYKALNKFSESVRTRIPAAREIGDAKYIALCGEIYVRRDHFSHKWLNKRFAQKGFILKDAYISEWIFYVDYLLGKKLLEPEASLKNRIERFIRTYFMRVAEYKIKKILAKSGYYSYSRTKIAPLLNHSKHIIPLEYKGEPGLTLGVALHETLEKYCGVVNLGPFGCMPTRLTEAVSVPEMKVENKIHASRLNNPGYKLPEIFDEKMNLPFLTIETDGNVYPQVIEARLETFLIQAERTAALMKEARMNGRVK